MAKSPNGVKRRRRPSQKGVQAVFTPESGRKQRVQLVAGLIAIGSGAMAWAYSTRGFEELGLGRYFPSDPSLSRIFLPLSIPLLIIGVGICTYYLAMRGTWRARNRIDSALYELEVLMGERNASPESSSIPVQETKVRENRPMRFVSKALFVALAEAILLISIYGGIVQEYASNHYMQNWIRTNFSLGTYFLNYNGVLALAGVLGALIFQLLPRNGWRKKSSLRRPSG